MSRLLRFLGDLAIVVCVVACGSHHPTTPTVASIQVSPSSTVTLDALQATQSFVATVTSSDGSSVSDAISWQSDAPSIVSVTGSGSSTTATAVANGTAHVTARTSNGITSSAVTVNVQQVASKLNRVSGDTQTAAVNTRLSAPLVASVTDRNNNPVAGAGVTFTATAGTLGAPSVTSGANGQVSNTWTLPTAAASYTVTATLSTNPSVVATFTATATAGAAQRLLKIDGDGQRATVGTAVQNPIIAGVVDEYGNGVAGVTVTLAALAGSGSLSSTSVVTNAAGQAQATWTLGVAATAQTATATASGLTGSPLSFSATALNASLDNLGPNVFKGGCKISGNLSGVIVSDKPRISVTVNGVAVAASDFTLAAAGTVVIITITAPTLAITTPTVVPVIVRVYSQNVQSPFAMTYSPSASC
jgi:adhesin/invasin